MECENVITWNDKLECCKYILENDQTAQLIIPLLYLEIINPDNEINSSELTRNLMITNDLLKACEYHKPEDQSLLLSDIPNSIFLKNIQEEILKQLGRL